MAGYSYIGKGPIYLGPYGGGGPMRPIGNVSKLEFSVNEDKKEQQDYTGAGGGTANVVSRITSVQASITMLDYSPENLATALRGTTSEVTASSVTAESHTAYLGGFVPLNKLLDTSQAVTIQNTTQSVSLTEGTDFMLGRGGIFIYEDAVDVADEDTIEVDYESTLSDVLQALTEAGQEFSLYFDGLNEAQSGKAVGVQLHRIKFTPAESLSLIGDEFGELPVTGDVLKDDSITGSGLSQYFKVAMEQ